MRVVSELRSRSVTAVASIAITLTILTLIVISFSFLNSVAWLAPVFLIGDLMAWGLLLVLSHRFRSGTARNHGWYEMMFENHPTPILLSDSATFEIVATNRAASKKYGYNAIEFCALSVFDLYDSCEHIDIERTWLKGLDNTDRVVLQIDNQITKDGMKFKAELYTVPLVLDERRLQMTVVTDVTERDDALTTSHASASRYNQIVDTAKEGIITVDADMAISSINRQASDMLGYSPDELVGRQFSEVSMLDETVSMESRTSNGDERIADGERETKLRDKDGLMVSVLLNESSLLNNNGGYAGQLTMITDLSERRGFEDELLFQSSHDPLTGLPNRLLLADRLQLALGRATQAEGGVAVVFIDLDNFKGVNTVYGQAIGDSVLVEVATRLSGAVRERDTVARFGGNEFAVVAEGVGLFSESLLTLLRDALAPPCMIDGSLVNFTTSMGLAVGRLGDRPIAILHDADLALMQAKAVGGDTASHFTEGLRSASRLRLSTAADLRRAIERHEFSLRFQPVVSLTNGGIVGAEALIRWEHPRRGTLGPSDFITIAEETGIIIQIGQWVIEETIKQLVGWQKVVPGLEVSLNISARQLMAGGLSEIIRHAVDESGIDPSYLSLELTESVLMDDVEFSCSELMSLRETGVTISIDDFGTGYSSLSYLNKFPIDILKIDQSFVAHLPDQPSEVALVQAILALAKSLNLSVIAEGVENSAQAMTLFNLGCLKAQGYYFYRPLTTDEFELALAHQGSQMN